MARDGIEPPTRGFSVASGVRPQCPSLSPPVLRGPYCRSPLPGASPVVPPGPRSPVTETVTPADADARRSLGPRDGRHAGADRERRTDDAIATIRCSPGAPGDTPRPG